MVLHDINNRLLSYLTEHGLIEGKGISFKKLAELYLDHKNLRLPLGVSYKAFIIQLYKRNELPDVGKVVISREKQPDHKPKYSEQLKDKRWHSLRLSVLKRDNHRCQLCDSTNHLHVHHKRYISGKQAWDYPIELLITLCQSCHSKFHNKKKKRKPKIFFGFNTCK